MEHRIFRTPVASVYPHYLSKVERKGRTQAELDEVIRWLTGFDETTLRRRLTDGATFAEFFSDASLNPGCLAHHRRRVRSEGTGGRRPTDAKDPLPRQARRRTRAG